jgi:hypothetical protein
MNTANDPTSDRGAQSTNASISDSVVGVFIAELAKKEGFFEIAKALEAVIYDSPSETSIRAALFGDEAI